MARGHIRERSGPKGTAWELRVYAGADPLSGKKRMVTRTVKGKRRDAERALTRLQAEVDAGSHAGPDGNVAALLAAWQRARAGDWAPTTVALYADTTRLHILPHLGARKVRAVRAHDLDALYGALVERGLSPARVRNVHTVLQGAFAQAVRWGWIPASPVPYARQPRVRRRDIDPPAPDDVRRLLDAARARRPSLHVLLVVAADTGARRGELVALRWGDFDLERGEVLIERTRVLAGRRVVEKETKTDGSLRRIALNAFTARTLVAHRARQAEAALAFGVTLERDAYLFTDEPDGARPWGPGSVSQRFGQLCRSVGVTGVRLHDLRHYVATQLLAAGVDVRTVAGRLGHANPNVTLSTYAHFVPARDREASDLLGRLLEGDS